MGFGRVGFVRWALDLLASAERIMLEREGVDGGSGSGLGVVGFRVVLGRVGPLRWALGLLASAEEIMLEREAADGGLGLSCKVRNAPAGLV